MEIFFTFYLQKVTLVLRLPLLLRVQRVLSGHAVPPHSAALMSAHQGVPQYCAQILISQSALCSCLVFISQVSSDSSKACSFWAPARLKHIPALSRPSPGT